MAWGDGDSEELSVSAEIALLGGLMEQGASGLERVAGLTPEHFCHGAFGQLFALVRSELEKGRSVSGTLLQGRVDGIDDDILLQMVESAAFGPEIGDFARIVSDKAMARSLKRLGLQLQAESSKAGSDPKDLLNHTAESLEAIREGQAWEEPVMDATCALGLIRNPQGAGNRILRTGIASLDKTVGGLPRGEVSVIAARPAMGKTALACVLGVNAIRGGESVGMCSLEMGGDAIGLRVATYAMWTTGRHVQPVSVIREGLEVPNGYREALADMLERGVGGRFMISERGGISTSEIDLQIRAWKRHARAKGLPPLGMVFVDHIGHVRPMARHTGKLYEKTSYVSNELLAVAKRHPDIAFVNLVQLKRLDKSGNRRPSLDDLRDSGKIEEDARVVMLIHREDYYEELKAKDSDASEEDKQRAEEKLQKVKNKAEIIVAKNTHGATGVAHIRHAVGQNVFRDPEWRPWEK